MRGAGGKFCELIKSRHTLIASEEVGADFHKSSGCIHGVDKGASSSALFIYSAFNQRAAALHNPILSTGSCPCGRRSVIVSCLRIAKTEQSHKVYGVRRYKSAGTASP